MSKDVGCPMCGDPVWAEAIPDIEGAMEDGDLVCPACGEYFNEEDAGEED